MARALVRVHNLVLAYTCICGLAICALAYSLLSHAHSLRMLEHIACVLTSLVAHIKCLQG